MEADCNIVIQKQKPVKDKDILYGWALKLRLNWREIETQ